MAQTILLIDDDAVYREAAQTFLEKNGYQVMVASSWLDFTKAFYGGPATPDVILFDVNLGPTVPGDRLLYIFKEGRKRLASAQKAKLVLLSGLGEEELKKRAEACGADGYIKKEGFTIKAGAEFLEKLRFFLRAQ